jgi:hypothetical protein
VIFTNADQEVLFHHSTADGAPELDISAVLSVCDSLPDCSPDLVYSMEMGPYYVDVASCLNLCCVSVVDRASVCRPRATALIPLTAMLVLSLQATSSPAGVLNFSRIIFHANPVELCFQLFSEFADGDPVQYFALVSSAGNIYTTFGDFRGSADSLCVGWDRVLGALEDLEGELFVMSQECNFAAAVDFLPFLKLGVFFDEQIEPECAARAAAAFHARVAAIPGVLVQLFSE